MGQRIGLFAPPGIGKSTLLSMICRHATADHIVICLVGERGREVNEFLFNSLDESSKEKVTVVVATSDETPLRKIHAPLTAISIAEKIRKQGRSVLFLMDSLTRYGRSLRDLGLASGQLPVRQGYPSSVFEKIAHFVERSGNDQYGSITAIYTVLTEDNENDPFGDEIKGLLDGHIYLSKSYFLKGIYPAVDPVKSCSRLLSKVATPKHVKLIERARYLIERSERDNDLVILGGIPDQELNTAIEFNSKIVSILNQDPYSKRDLDQDLINLEKLISSM
jgi:FliI/YscN family ATPase